VICWVDSARLAQTAEGERMPVTLKTSTLKYLDELISRLPSLDYLKDPIKKSVETICESYKAGGKLLICGNGGSAADSEHIAGELMKGFVLRRELPSEDVKKLDALDDSLASKLQMGVPAVVLTGHPALSTAIINDTDAFMAFAQQVYVLGKPGDVLIGLSTSGNSLNVVNAIRVARAFGLTSIAFTGSRPSDSQKLADITIGVPETETYRVQEFHLPIYHCVCLMVEEELFGKS
jgi:D-sedoheptulose 7-phosphate isomerase